MYADDAVLVCAASTPEELHDALERDFTRTCTWYSDNRLAINAKKTKLMLAGSKPKLSAFEDFELKLDGTQVNHVQLFKYLGVVTDMKWTWKPHIRNLLKKLSHRLSAFNRINHMLDSQTCVAYSNSLVLPHLDYADTVWGDQSGLKSEMEQLQAFQNRFAKKVQGYKTSSTEALQYLNWVPLAGRRFGHRCVVVQAAIKGEIPQHFESFPSTLRNSHGHNTRNGYLPRLPKPKTEWGKRLTHYRCTNDWLSLPDRLKKPMPCKIFKTKILKGFW